MGKLIKPVIWISISVIIIIFFSIIFHLFFYKNDIKYSSIYDIEDKSIFYALSPFKKESYDEIKIDTLILNKSLNLLLVNHSLYSESFSKVYFKIKNDFYRIRSYNNLFEDKNFEKVFNDGLMNEYYDFFYSNIISQFYFDKIVNELEIKDNNKIIEFYLKLLCMGVCDSNLEFHKISSNNDLVRILNKNPKHSQEYIDFHFFYEIFDFEATNIFVDNNLIYWHQNFGLFKVDFTSKNNDELLEIDFIGLLGNEKLIY